MKCECGKDFTNVKNKSPGRALHAHRLHCEVAKGVKRKSSKLCDCPDDGDWELLTKETEGAEAYLGQVNPVTGKKYTKWCTACKEVG